VVVKKGGRLVIDGGELTHILPNGRWKGIEPKGKQSKKTTAPPVEFVNGGKMTQAEKQFDPMTDEK
jgi:hypothetical protein